MGGSMDISDFMIRVVFLALPGIVSYMLFRKLAGKSKCEKWEEFCLVLLFSLLIYGTYGLIVHFWGNPESLTFFKAISDDKIPIKWSEIIIASLIGVPIAFISSALHTYKKINWFGRLVRVTRRFGDEDVWDYFHNLPDIPEYEWVFVRDHKTNLLYYGWIKAYSDSHEERELLMGNVSVFDNNSGELIYEVESMYFCRDRYDITIEIPKNISIEESKETANENRKESK
jgi:hypothetical protein